MGPSALAAAFGAGIVAGLGAVLPLGAIGVMLLHEGASRGWRRAVPAAAGVGTADLLFAVLALAAGSVLSPLVSQWGRWPAAVGGVLLLVVAALMVRKAFRPAPAEADGAEPVGWAAIHPRADTSFATNRRIPHVDGHDDPWSLWCVRVRPGHRKQGISHELVAGAVAFAREHGASVIEAYPVDNRGAKVDLTMAYVGTRALFERAGFEYVMDTTSVLAGFTRVLMRRTV